MMNLKWVKVLSSISILVGMNTFAYESVADKHIVSENKNFNTQKLTDKKNFRLDKKLAKSRYFVVFHDDPVATYKGGVQGFEATSVQVNLKKESLGPSQSVKLQTNSVEVQSYKQYLVDQQKSFMSRVENKMSDSMSVIATTQFALNGMLVELSPSDVKSLEKDPSVKTIVEDGWRELHTDAGPDWIGATQVWDGTATGVEFLGENVTVGIIDTGINPFNPAFASVGGDGYIHTNPFGAGEYRGDCIDDASLCNDKLIGVYSWPEITDQYEPFRPDIPKNGIDYDGHGSHVASTAAGNIMFDIPVYNAEGIPTDITFDRISGVMPHANIISYQVCLPGDRGDPLSGCLTSLTVLAVEEAIKDGVSVLNYSIGGGSFSPWRSLDALAFLAAREAGIHVATSAGNSGPNPSTVGSPAEAPWITSVANLSHNRSTSEKYLQDFTGGDASLLPESLSGFSLSGSITAPIVYAGDFVNPNDPEGDPAQCLQPFPEGTFDGEIVVCDRGAIARVAKGIHVRDGGAAGFVLANTEGGASSVDSDAHVIPAIHINAEQGTTLRTWLAQGADHTATITETEIIYDDSLGNIVNASSSRGPNQAVPNSLAVNVGAPGTAIYGAFAPETPFKGTPNGSEFAFLSGTSMASPHVAGALVAIAGLRPEWSPAEAQSALMLTANPNALKEDGVTPADVFDIGAGVVQIDAAVNAGLIMDESIENYEAANVATGGEPETLNIPQLVNSQCTITCEFMRTFKATRSGSWSILDNSGDSGMVIGATPADFILEEGESIEVLFTVDVSATQAVNQWLLGDVLLAEASGDSLHMPITVVPSFSNIPEQVVITANRDQGGFTLKDLKVVDSDSITVDVFGLTKADSVQGAVAQDSDNSSAFDDTTDGVEVFYIDVTEETQRVVAKIISSESPDLDLFVALDVNEDGVIDTNTELAAVSASGTALESIDFVPPLPGRYWVAVQNWQASSEGATDSFQLVMAAVESQNDNLNIDFPSSTDQSVAFDSLVNWDLEDSQPGDYYFGLMGFANDTGVGYNLGTTAVDIIRGKNDVSLTSNVSPDETVNYDDVMTYTITLLGNDTDEVKTYDLGLELSSSLELLSIDFDLSESKQTAESHRGFNPSSKIDLNNIEMMPGSSDKTITITAKVARPGWFNFSRYVSVTLSHELDLPGTQIEEVAIKHRIDFWSLFRLNR